MLKFSEKEYEFLKKDISEIRGYITKLIGFIISIGGLSTYLTEYIIGTKNPFQELIITFISIIAITFLFELIWYKFKSHNRYNGYVQLLSQEIDFIPMKRALKKEDIKLKDYIKNHRDYIKSKKEDKRIGKMNLMSWEFIMSRLNSSGQFHNDNHGNGREKLNKSIEKSLFVFQLPDGYEYDFIKNFENLDLLFSDKIILKLYRKKKRLIFYNKKNLKAKIDNRYIVRSWPYPNLITWISFIIVSLLTLVFFNVIISNYKFISFEINSIFNKNSLIIGLISLTVLGIYIYWFFKYIVFGLNILSSGRNSIDGYCWRFFIFRVQFLNSRDIIPIYFSRGFIRFF